MGTPALNETLNAIENETDQEVIDQVEEETPSEPEIDPDDQDAVQKAAALKELEEFEAAQNQPEEDPAPEPEVEPKTEETDEEKPQEGEEPDGDEKQKQVMIPKFRYDEQVGKERDRIRELELKNAELEGRLSEHKETKQPETDDAPKAKTVDEQVNDLNAEIDAIWEKADEGDVSLSEARKQERALQGKIDDLQQAGTQQQAEPQPEQKPDLYLETKTKEIVQGSDAAQHMLATVKDGDIKWMTVDAEVAQQVSERKINTKTAEGLLEMRKLQVEVIDKYAPIWFPDLKKAAEDPAPDPKPENKDPSPEALERAEKLKTAQRQPAPTNSMADGGSSHELTIEQISELSEDDLDKLPKSVREKALKGILH